MVSNARGSGGLTAYLSPFAAFALSVGCSVGWGAFVMPGTIFLPGAGPLGTLLGIALGVAADVEALVRAIRANPKLADMPVYAVTADVEIQKTYKSMGFTGIFLKPVTIEMLKSAAPFAGRGK